jgi:putative DNA methylase
MTKQLRRKLIEVSIPLEAINRESAREKSIRHGHPSTLHLWWARRPLAACRAVLFSQLVDDPSSCPEEFPTLPEQTAERDRLHKIIEAIVPWEASSNEAILNPARYEIARSVARGRGETLPPLAQMKPQAIIDYLQTNAPPVYDPFSGGGSIPLEAQRLGLRAMGSDLNPVAVLIGKALIEFPPKFAGRKPVNPEASSEWREVRSEGGGNALSGDDRLAEGNAVGPGGVSAGAGPAQGGDLWDAVATDESDHLGTGKHRRGLDAGIEEGKGAVSGDSSGFAGGSRNTAHPLRTGGMVRRSQNVGAEGLDGRSQPDADDFAPRTSKRVKLTPHSSSLFPRDWKGAQGLADDVRYYGRWMRAEAEKTIGHLYPKVTLADGKTQEARSATGATGKQKELTVIAWLWARTVPSPDPRAKGAHVPLASSFVLSAKEGREVIVRPVVDRVTMTWAFEIDDKPDAAALKAAKNGTKAARGANFTCLLTGAAIDDTHVKTEAMAGRMSAALMAIVAEGNRSRIYLAPNDKHIKAASVERPDVPEVDQPLPNDPRNFWTVSYGLDTFAKLFTPRQLVALTTFSDLVMVAREKVLADAMEVWSREGRGVRNEEGSLTPHSSPLTPDLRRQGGAGREFYVPADGRGD